LIFALLCVAMPVIVADRRAEQQAAGCCSRH
jgi:hypothetical protein